MAPNLGVYGSGIAGETRLSLDCCPGSRKRMVTWIYKKMQGLARFWFLEKQPSGVQGTAQGFSDSALGVSQRRDLALRVCGY